MFALRLTPALVLVSFVIAGQPILATAEEAAAIPENIMSAYLQADFSDVLAPYTQVPREELLITDKLGRNPDISALSDLEILLYGCFETESGAQFGCGYSVHRAIEYCQRFEEWPENGVELLGLYNGDLLTEEGFNEWLDAPRIRQLEMIRRAINPATGKVYPSFQCTDWEPLRILIEKLAGDDAFKLMPYSMIDPDTGETTTELRTYQTWRIVLYGEEPESVLVDKLIWTEVGGVPARPMSEWRPTANELSGLSAAKPE